MKKIEFIELVQDFLAGGDAGNEMRTRYHQKVIEKYISLAYNDVIRNVYLESLRYSKPDMLDVFTTPKFIDVSFDVDRQEYYSLLPTAITQIPDQAAIRLISPKTDQTLAFSYINNTSKSMWSVLEAGNLAYDVPDYYVENGKVFYNNFEQYKTLTSLLIKIVVPFEDLDWDAEVPMAAGKEFVIMEMVAKLLASKLPDDDINDNADEQVR